MKRCLIITGGKLDLSFAGSFLGQETFDKVIAVDAGLEAVKALGLEPDMIVGDFDTVRPEVLAYYRRMEHIVWDARQPEKDETDTELALLKAQATGCTEVVVLGATGGRMDHMLGNIHLLFPCLQKGMEAYILDSQNRIYLIDKERTFNRREIWGKYMLGLVNRLLPCASAVGAAYCGDEVRVLSVCAGLAVHRTARNSHD